MKEKNICKPKIPFPEPRSYVFFLIYWYIDISIVLIYWYTDISSVLMSGQGTRIKLEGI